MRKIVLALFVLLLTTTTAFAADGKAVTFKSGDQTAQGLLFLPTGAGPHPAIIVIQEFWGVNDWIKQQAADYAAQGYVALAVDLYRGQVANDPALAHELMRGLSQDQGVRDLVSAAAYLKTLPQVKRDAIGAVGWCMGGGYALNLAIAEPTLRAVAINYGSLVTDKDSLAKIHAAVLGNFGGQDRGIPPVKVNDFTAALKGLNKPVDTKIYPDAGHAFENPNNKEGYRAADAADAQERMRAFFAGNLKR
jgi:carboxymethylenebutenolidase